MKHFISSPALKNALSALAFLVYSGFLNAQAAGDWALQSEKNGVKLYSKTGTCANKNMLFIKLENTNSSAKHVNYNIIVESPGHNMPLLPHSVELKANETKAASCESDKELSTDIKNITNPKLIVILSSN